jgi:DNA-binding transcriptional LysR family regulator
MKQRPSINELVAFAAIVRHASFRAAADELGLSASTLSHMMRSLEERLGLRLFNRTTRSVAPTQAGAQLYGNLTPILAELDIALTGVNSFRDRPSGKLRINAAESAVRVLLGKIVPTFLKRYPDIHLDLVTEGELVDIVACGFDAGIRLAEAVPQDMIAIAFGGAGQFLAVASPDYLEKHGHPKTPDDLVKHQCIRFRLPSGKIYRWEFVLRDKEIEVDVSGPITLDHMGLMVDTAAKGLGIAYVWKDTAAQAISDGRLVPVLSKWTPNFAGHCLYYPSHRLVPAGLRAFVDVIKEVERKKPGEVPARAGT